MKKAIVVLLALVMLLALAACGTSSGGSSPSPSTSSSPSATNSAAPSVPPPASVSPTASAAPNSTGDAYPNCNPDGSINLDTIAHYDRNYDYTQNPVYKVCYISQSSGPLYQQSADAYAHWAPLFNCEWAGYVCANDDTKMFMTQLQNMIDQGVKGFIIDPDDTVFPSIISLFSKYPDVKWMSQMAAPRDNATGNGVPAGGNLLNPAVGFDNYDSGVEMTQKLIDWMKQTYPDVPFSDVGFVSMNFSTFTQLNQRELGSHKTWDDATGQTPGNETNYFVADCVAGGMGIQAGIDAITPIITTHTEFKYWLVMGLLDNFAQGAAQVIDQVGLTDTSCVVTMGGSNLQEQWDAGQQDSFRYALYTAQNLYAEPILGAVYAFLNGWATPQSIWPSWVRWDDHGINGDTFSQLRLPEVWLEHDSYKHYLKWTDLYAQANAYPDYPTEGINIDDFSAFTSVPPEYAPPA